MWKKVVKFIISLFWPEIKKLLAKYAKELLVWLEEHFKEVFSKKADTNAEEAESNAAEADYKAEQADSPAEAEKWKALADVWRQVAEKFRQENEQLEAELNSLRAAGIIKIEKSINTLDFDDAFDVSNDEVRFNDRPLLIERK